MRKTPASDARELARSEQEQAPTDQTRRGTELAGGAIAHNAQPLESVRKQSDQLNTHDARSDDSVNEARQWLNDNRATPSRHAQ
jgi:hypothetical protein